MRSADCIQCGFVRWLLDEWLDLVIYSVGRLVYWLVDAWLDLVDYLVGRLVHWLLDKWLDLAGYLVGRLVQIRNNFIMHKKCIN